MNSLIKWSLALAVLSFFSSIPANATNVSYGQCPKVGNDTSGCEILITRNPDGSFTPTASIPDLGPYDGVEDTLIGVQNNGPDALLSLPLSSSLTIFGFDGDGACTFISCSTTLDMTGYGGFISSNSTGVTTGTGDTFGSIASDTMSGTVLFGMNGIPAGGSAWFSLEDPITVQKLTVGMTPEPGSLILFGTGLFGLAGIIRRKVGIKKGS